jgi:hypothetical protein
MKSIIHLISADIHSLEDAVMASNDLSAEDRIWWYEFFQKRAVELWRGRILRVRYPTPLVGEVDDSPRDLPSPEAQAEFDTEFHTMTHPKI